MNITNQTFVKRYGMLAPSEKDTDPSHIEKRMESFAEFEKLLYDPSIPGKRKYVPNWILTFDHTNLLSLLPINDFAKANKSLSAKYRIFRGEYHRKLQQKVAALSAIIRQAAKEIQDHKDSGKLLQNLRDRSVRLDCLEREYKVLKDAVDSSKIALQRILDGLPTFQKVAFRIASFFHSIFRTPFQIDHFRLPFFDFWGNKESGGRCDKEVVGKSRIDVNGQSIPLAIVARCKVTKYDTKFSDAADTIFQIHHPTGNRIGPAFATLRVRKKYDKYKELIFRKEDSTPDIYYKDDTTKEKPLWRIMAQLAAEILLREDADTAIMDVCKDAPRVFVASGFHLDSPVEEKQWKEQILNARFQGKMFPMYKDLGVKKCYLKKSDVEKGIATVDMQSEETWLERIKKTPILDLPEGSILPEYYRTSPAY